MYNDDQLNAHLKTAETSSVTLECADNKSAKRLSYALRRRAGTSSLLVRISIQDTSVILSPRQPITFLVKE